jgi:hypothetical protein
MSRWLVVALVGLGGCFDLAKVDERSQSSGAICDPLPAGLNLLPPGDADFDGAGPPNGWIEATGIGFGADAARCIAPASSWFCTSAAGAAGLSGPFPAVTAGKRYQLRMWMRGDAPVDAGAPVPAQGYISSVFFSSDRGTMFTGDQFNFTSLPSDWEIVATQPVVAPAGASVAEPGLFISVGSACVVINYVSIEEVD